MSPSLAPPTPPIPRRRWLQFSLRTLLLVITAASVWLAWLAYRAQQQAIAVAALRELRGHATSKVRNPDWLWRLFGERLGRTMVRVELDSDQVAAAIPHLKAFPDLEEVQIASWPQESHQGDDAETLLHQHLPLVKTRQVLHMLDTVTLKGTAPSPPRVPRSPLSRSRTLWPAAWPRSGRCWPSPPPWPRLVMGRGREYFFLSAQPSDRSILQTPSLQL